MSLLRVILPDQLSHNIASLSGFDKDADTILICELMEDMTYVKHHKKKIAFLLSAMRHFAEELEGKGYKVRYIKLDDSKNKQQLGDEIKRAVKDLGAKGVVTTYPGEYRTLEVIKKLDEELHVPLKLLDDDRFLCDLQEFAEWAGDSKQLRMETFYRRLRKKHDILMDGDKPVGGQWNYDADNRKPPKKSLNIPDTYHQDVDDITNQVIELVEDKFSDHFGDLRPFHFAVTRRQALVALRQFTQKRLENFGQYQDAMLQNEPWMYHSHISFYLNCGLLLPLECIEAAVEAYDNGNAPLNSVEGFVRQILGWREYVRGIYWHKMPKYQDLNYFNAKRNLPEFYWTAKTKMNCIKQCVTETKNNAYAHHIQRLMVLGNFALVAGLDPVQVNEWYLIVYADAYQWVELPNVTGMILFADGGYLASKPYASSGNYINKMSDYCKNCEYKVSVKTGDDACPFNYLYWDFLDRNRDKLSNNHRIGMMYKTYDKMSEENKDNIKRDSKKFLNANSS